MGKITNCISIYSRVDRIHEKKTIPLDLFLDDIQNGKWQDIVLPVRAIADKKERDEAKKLAPCVTIAGTFKERTDNGLQEHSGYIAVDIDTVPDPEKLKQLLSEDRYVVAAFTSISGRGLCVLFKVVPDKHREAFQGIGEYLYNEYKIICDPTSINISRPRFVSFDPNIFIANREVAKFTLYPKNKPPKKIEKVIYSPDDFGEIMNQVVGRRLNLCESYQEWLRIAFALIHQFGEQGREYFHLLSQFSSKYNSNITDKQFNACLKHRGSNYTTISTFYYYAKEAGIPLYTERTRKIAYTAINGKKGGLNAAQIAETLEKFEGITGAEDIIRQVLENDIELTEDGLLEQLELWMRQSYELKRNEITRYIETQHCIMQQKDFNTIFIRSKKIFDKLNYDLFDRLINSDFVNTYHPIKDFLQDRKQAYSFEDCKGSIDNMFSAVPTDREYIQYFGKKWVVGMLSAVYGEHSPLMLILAGKLQNTGKTEFFRRMLPKELFAYYAESKLDAGKDDEILMTQKLLIMDDEMGGKSKKEAKRLKELTSKQVFSLREPYGRNNVDLIRLASLGGTSNDYGLKNDPTGNRRMIICAVEDKIRHDIYNQVDKTKMILEALYLLEEGFDWRVNSNDTIRLNKDQENFETLRLEEELIMQYFKIPELSERGICDKMTASQIKIFIEDKTRQKLSLDAISKELQRLGFEQHGTKLHGKSIRLYHVMKTQTDNPGEDLPF